MLSGWTFLMLFVFMRTVMHSVALNGKRNFLIWTHSHEHKFTGTANQALQTDTALLPRR